MVTQHEIGAEEHHTFFERALRDPTRAYHLGLDDEALVALVTSRDIDGRPREHGVGLLRVSLGSTGHRPMDADVCAQAGVRRTRVYQVQWRGLCVQLRIDQAAPRETAPSYPATLGGGQAYVLVTEELA